MKQALALGLLALWPARAAAEPAAPNAGLDPNVPAPPEGVHLVDEAVVEPAPVPRARDLLGGHFLLGASASPTWALGKLGSSFAAARALGTGIGLRADAGLGVSRSVTIGVQGSWATYADGDDCSGCSGSAWSLGPFVRYQLAQGLRLDPWISLGSSYRKLGFDGEGGRRSFSGVEWLRLELGADYYIWSGLGFGPYAGLGLSSFIKRPDSAGDAAVGTELSLGLRLLLDLPGR